MYKRLFLVLLFLIPVGVMLCGVVIAREYTTKRHSSSTQETTEEHCSTQDKREIKSFDRKAKEMVILYRQMEASVPYVKTPDDALEFGELYMDVAGFFEAEVYVSMAVIYDRCGQKIPSMEHQPPFWAPFKEDEEQQQEQK